MPILLWSHIERRYTEDFPYLYWVFGDNEERRGFGGLAKQLRGAPNALGICTKRSPSMEPEAFWREKDFKRVKALIDADFKPVEEALAEGKRVVFPRKGIGSGLAKLADWAPSIKAYIDQKVLDLCIKYGIDL